MPHIENTVTTLAYLAGIIDGEGHLGVKRSKAYACQGRTTPGYHARVAVKMVDRPAVAFLHATFGGTFRQERRQTSARRDLWVWAVTDLRAEECIRRISPYLRVKRGQAAIVLTLRRLQRRRSVYRTKITGTRTFPNKYGTIRTVNNKCFSDEYVAMCHAKYMGCRRLNGLAAKIASGAIA